MGSTVPEALPSAPGDIRAYDVQHRRAALELPHHPAPRRVRLRHLAAGRVEDRRRRERVVGRHARLARAAMVFAATGSASYDFYGAQPRSATTCSPTACIALDARTGKRVWHFQGLQHDLWDRDLPAAPVLVTVTRDGKPVDAVAQITKTGHVFVFDRATGTPLFPIERARDARGRARRRAHGADAAVSRCCRRRSRGSSSRESELTTRTPAAHAAALKLFQRVRHAATRSTRRTRRARSSSPASTAAASGAGPRSTRQTGLLYVNANEMAWLLKLVPRSDRSLYAANCASCHGDERQGSADGAVARGRRRASDRASRSRRSSARARAACRRSAARSTARAMNDIVNYLITGQGRHRPRRRPDPFGVSSTATAYFDIFLDHEGYPAIKPPWGTLNAIDLNAGTIRWTIPFGEYPKLAAKGVTQHRHRQLRRRDRHGERAAAHRRDDLRQQVPRVRQAHRQAALGGDAARRRQRDAVDLHGERAAVRRHRLRRREERRAERRHLRRVRAAGRDRPVRPSPTTPQWLIASDCSVHACSTPSVSTRPSNW